MKRFHVVEHGLLRPGDEDGPTKAQINALLDAGAEAGRRLAPEGRDMSGGGFAAEDRVLVPARGGALRTRGVVGVLVAGDATLEILPKIDRTSGGGDAGRARDQLVHMLADAYGLPLDLGPDAALGRQGRTLLDVVIAAFVTRLEKAVRGGLARRYVPANDDLPVLRGRLDVRRQYTSLLATPYRIACRFDELSVDTPLNRCLKATFALLARHAVAEPTMLAIRTLLPAFDDVRDRAADFPAARRRLDRTDRAFHELLDLAELLMRAEYQSTTGGGARGLALLFDMPMLFERAIATAMRRVVGAHARVVAQDAGRCLMVDPAAYTLRPDLLIERPGAPPLVVDTKWKHLDAGTKPSSADAYQMLAYAHAFGARDCVLLYPDANPDDGSPRIVSTFAGRDLPGPHGPSRWKLHRAHVSLQDYRTLDAQLRRLVGELTRTGAFANPPPRV